MTSNLAFTMSFSNCKEDKDLTMITIHIPASVPDPVFIDNIVPWRLFTTAEKLVEHEERKALIADNKALLFRNYESIKWAQKEGLKPIIITGSKDRKFRVLCCYSGQSNFRNKDFDELADYQVLGESISNFIKSQKNWDWIENGEWDSVYSKFQMED